MNAIIKNLIDSEKFKDYLENIKQKISPINLLGLTDVAKVQFLMATKEQIKKPICQGKQQKHRLQTKPC